MRKGNLAQQNISNLNAEPRTSKAHGNQARRLQNRNRRGFTLPEVLLTVAILVVIFAVAVIGVSKFQQSLRQKELDSKAEIIYMAAQNRITELMASGRSDLYMPYELATTTEKGTTYTSNWQQGQISKLTLVPCDSKDYEESQKSDTVGSDIADRLWYVAKTDTPANYLLPVNRVDQEIRDNYWVIEYSPKDGKIYGVFYSEEAIDYADNQDKYNLYRIKSQRMKAGAKVGYYGGDFDATNETSTLSLRMKVENEEELTAVISCNTFGIDDIKFEITIKDAFGNTATKTVEYPGEYDIEKDGRTYSYRLVLDSLKEGKGFAEQFPGLVPGSDITITCKASTSDSTVSAETCESEKVNSLFGSVEFTNSGEGTTSGTSLTDGIATITYGRHLQNLDMATSGVNVNSDSTGKGRKGTLTVTSAVQKNNIHFDDDQADVLDWYDVYSNRGFTAIKNTLLTSYSGSYTDDKGNKLSTSIHGLNTAGGGLFDTFYGNTLEDITLTGTTITKGNSSDAAGALCAETENSGSLTISGCKVYLDESKNDLTTAKADSDGNLKRWIKASKYVGGLIGRAQNSVTIKESFASTVAGSDKTTNTGGLVGYVSGSLSIDKSYADCYLYGKTVGGLIGGGTSSAIVNVSNSYAVGFATASDGGAGFYPGNITSASTSYSAMSFDGKAATDKKVYPIATGYTKTPNKLSYVTFSGINGELKKTNEKNVSVGQMSGTNKATFIKNNLDENVFASNTYAYPYNLNNNGLSNDYSLPGLQGVANYGDWDATFENGSLVYYEQYKSESGETVDYGINGANTYTLKDNKTVVGDGYGIVFDVNPHDVNVTYNNGTNESASETAAVNTKIDISDGKNGTLYLIKLPKDVVNTTNAPDGFYQSVTLDDKTWYYNPHFMTVPQQSEPSATNEITTVNIRTARQLHNLSLYYGNYAYKTTKSTYSQKLDIDYGEYNWSDYFTGTVNSQNPIGAGSNLLFSSTYDGNCHTITGVSFKNTKSSSYYGGMFGYNEGTLQNIFVVWDYTAGTDMTVSLDSTITGSTTKAYIGTLAGKNTNKITNCGVCGYSIKCSTYNSSTTYIGGLVGENKGTITKSYADTPSFAVNPDNARVRVGGFVGGNENTIRSCYASGYVRITGAKKGSVDVGGFFGENSGNIRYAYCTNAVELAGVAQGYGFGPKGGYTKNCRYLANGTYIYVGELKLYELADENENTSAISAKQLKELFESDTFANSGFGKTEITKSYASKTDDQDNNKFPYPAVTTNANGEVVHYGNWVQKAELGGVGVFYWENESTGSNAGYHISYIGVTSTGNTKEFSSLCDSHDDGGIISEYGYGYYIEKDGEEEAGNVTLYTEGFGTFDTNNDTNRIRNDAAERELEKQLDGFSIYAYTTGSTDRTGDELTGYLYLGTSGSKGVANGTWKLNYTKSGDTTSTPYYFTVNPFFANSFTYDGTAKATSTLGTTETQGYGVRSRDQLQYINWNAANKDVYSTLIGDGDYLTRECKEYCDYFTYLKYLTGGTDKNVLSETKFYWNQTHDVNMKGTAEDTFTPIGSMYYTNEKKDGQAYITAFTGAYNGEEYMIEDIYISADEEMIGLFGITVQANLSNINLYSKKGNVIENQKGDSSDTASAACGNKWYCIGGLVGFAAVGPDIKTFDAGITNCSVAGYTIKDNRSTSGAWGGAAIGGLLGASNMNISKCSAVNDIEIDVSYQQKWENIRVGGLVGNLSATVDSCYSGGAITSNVIFHAKDAWTSTAIWVGGINGGIVMVKFEQIDHLVGSVENKAAIKNSYTYVNIPKSGEHSIYRSEPIGSLGEMSDNNYNASDTEVKYPTLEMYNCYAYVENVQNATDITEGTNHYTDKDYWSGKTDIVKKTSHQNRTLTLYNNGKSPFVTYAQLSAASKLNERSTDKDITAVLNGNDCPVIDLLNHNRTKSGATSDGSFSFVTVEENNTRIDGKYSFAAGDTSLENANYPFPTVLTQTNASGETVYVHYGKWPKSGIYWEKVTLSIDLFDDFDRTVAKKEMKLTASGTPTYSYLNENREELGTHSVTATEGTKTSGVYNVIIKAVKEGTEVIRATLGGVSSDLKVEVTAKMNLTSDPESITLKKAAGTATDEPRTIVLNAKTTNGTSLSTDADSLTWTVDIDNKNVASIVENSLVYDPTKKTWSVKVKAVDEGYTSLHAVATYKKTINNEEQTFTEELIIPIDVEY